VILFRKGNYIEYANDVAFAQAGAATIGHTGRFGTRAELRVLPLIVEMHGVWSSSEVTLTPNSVNAFCGRSVTWLPDLSKFGHGPPLIVPPLLNAQIVSAPLQPSPARVADLEVLGAVPVVHRDRPDAATGQEVHRHDHVTDTPNPGERTRRRVRAGVVTRQALVELDLVLEELDVDVAVTVGVQPLEPGVDDQVIVARPDLGVGVGVDQVILGRDVAGVLMRLFRVPVGVSGAPVAV
jgi:hypothetical protein